MGRLVSPNDGNDRLVKPKKKEDLHWYENNPWLIGGIILFGLLIILVLV